jgi:ABC-type transport system substrate-binding protein
MQVFDGLLGFNQDLTLKPVTAVEIPTVANGGISADGLTYTLKLRPEVTWSDGKKVVAADYVYSIGALLSLKWPPNMPLLLPIVGMKLIAGSAIKTQPLRRA